MDNNILYLEINLVCSLVLLLLCIKVKNSTFIQAHRRLFLKVAISNIIFLVLDALWIFVNDNVIRVTISFNWLLNAFYFVMSGVLSYYWFEYSETIQNSSLVRTRKNRILTFTPAAILVALTILSLKTEWIFYIDEGNQYHRGGLYFLQLITSYGYILVTAVKAFYLSFKTEEYQRKSELRILATFVLPTLLAGSLQVIFAGYPILCVGNTIGILYIYLTMQEQLVSLDALTKLNNRNQLYQYLSTKLIHRVEDKNLYLLIMDVDYFKSINDKYGHVEGDRALKFVAGCLKKVCSNKNYFVARYGGDEFVVLCELEPTEKVEDVCQRIHNQLATLQGDYKITVSIGCAKLTTKIKTQQEFIDMADKELYKVKKSRKILRKDA